MTLVTARRLAVRLGSSVCDIAENEKEEKACSTNAVTREAEVIDCSKKPRRSAAPERTGLIHNVGAAAHFYGPHVAH